MAVATISRFRIRPGRNVEFNGFVQEARKIQQRLGGKVRVWTASFAGPDAGAVSYVVEHADLAAFASFSEKLSADAEWLAFLPRAFSADPAADVLSNSLVTEMPG